MTGDTVPPPPRSALLFGLAFAILSGLALALGIVLIEQSFNQRNACVLAVLVSGAAVAGVIAAWIGRRLARRWPAFWRFAAMAVGLTGGTLFIAGGLYSVLVRDILGQFDMDDLGRADGIIHFMYGHGALAYLMLVGDWNLLLSWPLPAASAVAAFLFATHRL